MSTVPGSIPQKHKQLKPTPVKLDGEPREDMSDDALFDMQEKLYGKNGNGQAPDPAPDNPSEPNPNEPTRADLLFKRGRETAQSKPETPQTPDPADNDNEDFSGTVPGVDFSGFEDDENEEEETTPAPQISPPAPESKDFSKETNLRNLRQIASDLTRQNQELESRLAQAEEQIKSVPDASGYQTTIAKLQERIRELEPLQMIYDLRNHPEYKSKYIEPANGIIAEMKKIAADYGVGEDVVHDVLGTENRAELDEVLESAFHRESPRQDMKMLKQRLDNIMRERTDFEKQPAATLEQFESRKQQMETEKLQRRDAHLQRVAAEGWSLALGEVAELPKDQKIYELIEVPGKTQHNEKVVKPTLRVAHGIYNQGLGYIEKCIRNQLVVSPDFTKWFSMICQQAAATQMINGVRNGLYLKMKKDADKQNSDRKLTRPGMNGAPRGSTAPKPQDPGKKRDGREVAAEIFMSVTGDDEENL